MEILLARSDDFESEIESMRVNLEALIELNRSLVDENVSLKSIAGSTYLLTSSHSDCEDSIEICTNSNCRKLRTMLAAAQSESTRLALYLLLCHIFYRISIQWH